MAYPPEPLDIKLNETPFSEPEYECRSCGRDPDHIYCERWLEWLRRFFGGKPVL